MKALVIPLILEGPVLITNMGNGDENSSSSLPYIKGSSLRGLLIGRYLAENPAKDLLDDSNAVDLFFSENVSFLNAYPSVDRAGLVRSLPLPLSWYKKKDEALDTSLPVQDFAVDIDESFDENLRFPFCSPDVDNERVPLLRPEQVLATHISGEARGVVRAEQNTVFQYQALAAGQKFTAVILTKTGDMRKRLRDLLVKNPIMHLGRSRSARYGRIRIDVDNLKEKDDEWKEASSDSRNAKTIITLLSDAILRDEFGQQTNDLDLWLAARLNKPGLKSSHRFITNALIGGFNRKWGLPLPQTHALGMGSVFVYPSSQLTPDDLSEVLENGVGERCVEGFGRIAVNWHTKPRFEVVDQNPISPPRRMSLSDTSQLMAKQMAEKILRQRLDALLSETALRYRISGSINNHQLSRLRYQLRQVINAGSGEVNRIISFLGDLKSKAADQYKRSRVFYDQHQSSRLRNWLEEKLDELDGLTLPFGLLPTVAGQKAEMKDELKKEYTLRLIEAVVNLRMKENRRE
jgi:CRISPR-associated protein Csx10